MIRMIQRHHWIEGHKAQPQFYERTDGWQIKCAPNGTWTLSRPGIHFFAVFKATVTQPEKVQIAANNLIIAFEIAAKQHE